MFQKQNNFINNTVICCWRNLTAKTADLNVEGNKSFSSNNYYYFCSGTCKFCQYAYDD